MPMKASFLPPVRCQPICMARAQCSQRRRERTTSAVVFLVIMRCAVNRCSPSRVNSSPGFAHHPDDHLSLALRHSHRQQRSPLFQHFLFGARVWRSSKAAASGKFGVINETCGNNDCVAWQLPKVKAAGRRLLPDNGVEYHVLDLITLQPFCHRSTISVSANIPILVVSIRTSLTPNRAGRRQNQAQCDTPTVPTGILRHQCSNN